MLLNNNQKMLTRIKGSCGVNIITYLTEIKPYLEEMKNIFLLKKIIFKRKAYVSVECFIDNSLLHAKDCHIRVFTVPNTHVVVQFAIKLKITHWRIVTIEIDTKYSFSS